MNYMAFQYSLKPVIAQVHGVCTGAGLYLVELVDLAIAADTARFSHAEQRLGLAGNTWQLNTEILLYGPKRARELMLLGEEFDGPAGRRLGPGQPVRARRRTWRRPWTTGPGGSPSTPATHWSPARPMHQMALDSLGGTQQFWRGTVGHTLGTNLRFEDGRVQLPARAVPARDPGRVPRAGRPLRRRGRPKARAAAGVIRPAAMSVLQPELLDLPRCGERDTPQRKTTRPGP